MAGRPTVPTQLKLLHGNPGHHPLNKNEPKPEPLAPKCPGFLDRTAKKEWKRMVELLEPLGLISKLDMAALAAYCQTFSRWAEAEAMIRKQGMLVKTPNGYPQLSPFLVIANKALEQMKGFAIEFGMTAVSRSKINLPGNDKPKDDFEEYLNRGKAQKK